MTRTALDPRLDLTTLETALAAIPTAVDPTRGGL
jgi:hypothetical protein